MAAPRLAAELALVTSASCLILAMRGLCAVLAYLVAQRRTELTIRMSIGAAPQQIVRFIAAFWRQDCCHAGPLGLAGSFLASRLVQTQAGRPPTRTIPSSIRRSSRSCSWPPWAFACCRRDARLA
jgi:hypothetical protein